MKANNHIIVAMSGGVDSSVAALLLHEQGYHVEGLFMKNWEDDDTETYCAAAQDARDAQAVCDKLGIKLHRVNFAAEYWETVFELFLKEYQAGRTPNPDILCNREIKFKALLDYALQLGADYIATGHYVRLRQQNNKNELLTAVDSEKDQSYFLYALNQSQLMKSMFPLGELTKSQVREIAHKAGFITHDKKDSTGICFIGERKFKTFLQNYLGTKPGNIESVDGKIIAKHDGLMYYTIGQRQGLGIGGNKGHLEAPWYVVDKDINRNVLIVAQGHDHPRLYANQLICSQLNWIQGEIPDLKKEYTAKIRYRQAAQTCQLIKKADQEFIVNFEKSQRAITPGQSIVFYNNEVCLGGGIIK